MYKRLTQIIEQVHPEWRDDFVSLVVGNPTSETFDVYFNRSRHIQTLFEKAIRVLDEPLLPFFKKAFD